jgi:hypothetical protein
VREDLIQTLSSLRWFSGVDAWLFKGEQQRVRPSEFMTPTVQKQMLSVIDSYFSTADLQVKFDTLLRLDPLDGLIRGGE